MAVQERTRKQAFGSAYSSQIQSFQISGCQTPWMMEEQIWNLFEKTQTHKSMSFGSWQIDDMDFSVAGVTKLKILTWWGPRLEVEKRPQKPELQWKSLQDVLTIF